MTFCTRRIIKASGIHSAIFLDERFAEEDLSEILDTDEIARIKTPPIIPAMIEFVPENPGDVESDEARRARARGQALADLSLIHISEPTRPY